MKIAICINTSWNIYNFRLGLIKALQHEGHKVIAVAPGDPYVSLLEKEGVECHPIEIDSKSTNVKNDLKLLRTYYKILHKTKPDLILSYTIKPNIYGNLAARILKIPVINNVSGLGTVFIRKSLTTFVAILLYKLAFAKSAWIFFQNEEDQKIFLRKKIQRKKKTSVIPGSGVNLHKFNTTRNKNTGRKVLFVGRLIGDKGIREFIEAGKKLNSKHPDVVFEIVGELGPNNKTSVKEQELDEWLNLSQFKYLGKSDEMKSIFEQTDIMVLPSYREGLSKSLIEACAMKLPIVTTDVPGCRDVVTSGYNGYLCSPKNSADLAAKISKVLNASEQERLEMGSNARRLAELKFDEKKVIQLYLEKITVIANKSITISLLSIIYIIFFWI